MTVSRSYCNCNECIMRRLLNYRMKYYATIRQNRMIDFIKFYAQCQPIEELLEIRKGVCEGISISSLVFSPQQWRNLMDTLHSIPSIPDFFEKVRNERIEWVKKIRKIKTDFKDNPNKQHQIIEQTRQKQNHKLSNLYAFIVSIYWYQIRGPVNTFKNKKHAFSVIDKKLHWVGDLYYIYSLAELRQCIAIINRVLAENNCKLASRLLINAGMHKARISYEPNLHAWFVMDPNYPFGIFFGTRNLARLAEVIFAVMDVPVQFALGLTIEYFFYGNKPPNDLFLKIKYTLHKECFKFSFEKIKQHDYFGIDLLFLAVMTNKKVLVEAILKRGVAHINQINFFGYTSLYVAVRGGYLEIVKLLLNKSANPNLINPGDPNGFNALHIAIRQDDKELIFWLLLRGADPNIQTKHGYSGLHIAAEQGDIISCDLLLRAGAYTRLLDGDGKTPFDVARLFGNSEVIRILDQYEREQSQYQVTNYSNEHNRITFFQSQPPLLQQKLVPLCFKTGALEERERKGLSHLYR